MRILILFLALGLAGCKLDAETAKEVAQLRQDIAQQDKTIQSLQRSNEALKTELAAVKVDTSFNTLMLNIQTASYTAGLSLTDKSFSTVRTDLGIFLVSVQDV